MLWRGVICAVIGYLLGNIETSILISKYMLKDDIRNSGSGNAGSTNMLRTHGIAAGIMTFVGDIAKAVIATLIGLFVGKTGDCVDLCMCIGGFAVILGHNFPVFFSFKGGKGIASTLGVLLVIVPYPIAVVSLAISLLLIFATRMVSVGSLVGVTVAATLIYVMDWGNIPYMCFAACIVVLAYVQHRKNIYRILHGTEKKLTVGKKKK